MYSGVTGGLLFVARLALLAWRLSHVCAFGGFLLYFLLAYAFLTITSLCNTKKVQRDICYSFLLLLCDSFLCVSFLLQLEHLKRGDSPWPPDSELCCLGQGSNPSNNSLGTVHNPPPHFSPLPCESISEATTTALLLERKVLPPQSS